MFKFRIKILQLGAYLSMTTRKLITRNSPRMDFTFNEHFVGKMC